MLLPSDAEGFALPLVEAMACGRPVVASDLPVLREVGGDVALYCPVADVPAWTQTTCALLERHDDRQQVGVRTARAARFSWDTYSDKTVEVYRAVAEVAAGRKIRAFGSGPRADYRVALTWLCNQARKVSACWQKVIGGSTSST